MIISYYRNVEGGGWLFEFWGELCYIQNMEENNNLEKEPLMPIVDDQIEGQPETAETPILHRLDEEGEKVQRGKKNFKKVALFLVVFLFFYSLGLVFYWWRGSSSSLPGMPGGTQAPLKTAQVQKGKIIGVDSPIFKDTAEGLLEKNTDETKPGTHILIRGDKSQTAYLTSSVIDLDKYVGHKVKVWGETQAVESVGWFMDIGKLQILD